MKEGVQVGGGGDMAAEGETAMMPRRRRLTAGSHRSRRRPRHRHRRGGDQGFGVGWLGARRRGIWLGEEGRGGGVEGGELRRGIQAGELQAGTVEACGLGTTTGRGARDGDPVEGRGVVVGIRSRVVGMRAPGLGARVGGETVGEGRNTLYLLMIADVH